MDKKFSVKKIVAFLLACHSVFVFVMPDKYLGVADYYIFFVFVIVLAGIKGVQNGFRVSRYQKPFLVLHLMLLLPSLIAIINGGFEHAYALSYMMYFLAIMAAVSMDFNKEEMLMIVNGYLVAGIIMSLIILAQRVDYYDGSGYRFTVQVLGHDKFDPNFIGAYLVVPLLLSFAKYIYQRKKVFIISSLIIGFGILMSSSRGALVATFIGIVFIFWGSLKGKNKGKTVMKYFAIGILIVFVAIYLLPQGSFNRLFVYSYFDSSNSKRLMDWQAGLEAFIKRPILGYGFQSEINIINNATGHNLIAHNTYIAFLLQFGLLGTIMFLWFLIRMIITSIKQRGYIIAAIIVSTLFTILLVSGQVAQFLWYPILLCVCLLQYTRKNNNETMGGLM